MPDYPPSYHHPLTIKVWLLVDPKVATHDIGVAVTLHFHGNLLNFFPVSAIKLFWGSFNLLCTYLGPHDYSLISFSCYS